MRAKVTLTIEMQQGAFNDLSETVILQKTTAVTAIQKILNPIAPFEISFFLWSCAKFLTPASQHGLRERIEQVKRDMLR